MRLYLSLIALTASLAAFAQDYPSAEWQIATAVLAAPEHERANATVLGYKADGTFAVLRKGSNDLICLADDPAKKGFSVACYHESLESFMVRGRELKKEGKKTKEIFQIREDEVKSGKLSMPERALLNVMTGEVNEETKEIEKTHLRWVFYIPFATSESTGLPLAAVAPGAPWIMNAGTHGAHIMITPPKNKAPKKKE
ncbi:MAG: hypothetical protein ACI92G_001170 [Candidatus Pelagisphaera sp.]|jgi:hypothetical protein